MSSGLYILPLQTKICTKCGENKVLSEFWKDKRAPSGYLNSCKTCCGKHRLAYRDQALQTKKSWYSNRKNKPKKEVLTQVCLVCKVEKDISDFYKNCSSNTGRQAYCKTCVSKKTHEKYHGNAEYRKSCIREATVRNRKSKYGITPEVFEAILAAQGHKCAICEVPLDGSRFSLKGQMDHCHSTGKIRGVLCSSCNTSLGGFKDNEKILLSAMNYLIKYRENNDFSS